MGNDCPALYNKRRYAALDRLEAGKSRESSLVFKRLTREREIWWRSGSDALMLEGAASVCEARRLPGSVRGGRRKEPTSQ